MNDAKDIGSLAALGLGHFKPVFPSIGTAENEENNEAGRVEDSRGDQPDPDGNFHPAKTAKKLQEQHQDRRFDEEYHKAVKCGCDNSNLFKTLFNFGDKDQD